MSYYNFSCSGDDIRSSFNRAKIIKPEGNDYAVCLNGKNFYIVSFNKRSYCVNIVSGDMSSISNDPSVYFLPSDRTDFISQSGSNYSFIEDDKGLNIICSNGSNKKTAVLRGRSNNKRSFPSDFPGSTSTIDSKIFSSILTSLSTSANVKGTKTEDDMKINQIHFYGSDKCAQSSSRFHSTQVFSDHICFDLSVISSDIPIIRSFSQRVSGDVKIFCDQSYYYFSDSLSFFRFSRIVGNKPSFSVIDSSDFSDKIFLEKEKFIENLHWANSTLEGGRKIVFNISDNVVSFSHKYKTSEYEINPTGKSLILNLPSEIFYDVVSCVNSDTIDLSFGNSKIDGLMMISESYTDFSVKHFLRSVKGLYNEK